MNEQRWWEWWWGTSQTTVGGLLAALIVYIATIAAGVVTFHLALISAGVLLGVAMIGLAFYASSKLPSGMTVDETLERIQQLKDEGAITRDDWRRIRRKKDDRD